MKKRVIFVMNRWDSSKGGIQTVNRELLLALARFHHDLECFAVVTFANEAEVNQAYRNGVTLIHGGKVDDWTLVLMSEQFRDIDPSSVLAVVGHSSFSGETALQLRNFWFKEAPFVQFIHMDPMRTEGIKEYKQNSYVTDRETKHKQEIEIAKKADLVFCVGPRLHRVTRDIFMAHQLELDRVHRIDCGLSPDISVKDATPEQPTVVCLGRTESIGVKGLDIFAQMAGFLDQMWDSNPLLKNQTLKPRFIVRGAEEKKEEFQEQLVSIANLAGGNPEIIVRPYTTQKEDLDAELRGASVFIMPSREEGFGLVACEALSFGTPIIVSRQSGIAELIEETERKTGQDFSSCIVSTVGKAEDVAENFANAILPILVDNVVYEDLFPRLRGHLSSICSWEKGASVFFEKVESLYQRRLDSKQETSSSINIANMPHYSASFSIEHVLAQEKEALMAKQGVIAVGTKQAIIVTVEKGAKPNLPKTIGGFEVIIREAEEVKLTAKTSNRNSGGYEVFLNGERRATAGLFGIDDNGFAFALTVAHAFVGHFNPKIEMLVNGRHIPLKLTKLDEKSDWAILRIEDHSLSFSNRALGFQKLGKRVLIETTNITELGYVDSIDVTLGLYTGGKDKQRYENMFEIAAYAGIEPGDSGSVVSNKRGEILGIVVGSILQKNGSMSVIARDVNEILEQNNLRPATIDLSSKMPHIGLLLDSPEAAEAVLENMRTATRFSQSGQIYFRGTTDSGIQITCTIIREFSAVTSAVSMTSMLINNKPDAVFVLTKCTGLQRNLKIGDAVISSEVQTFDPTFSMNTIYSIKPKVHVSSNKLIDLSYRIVKNRYSGVHVGRIASSNSTMNAIDIKILNERSPSLISIDLGAAGAIQAAKEISVEIPTIVIGAVVELADEKKYESFSLFENATEIMFDMISFLDISEENGYRHLVTNLEF